MFIIEDELHAEIQAGEFEQFAAALEELKSRANIPWNEEPNTAPCTSWQTCGRSYEIVEYDVASLPWKEISRTPALKIDATGVKWLLSNPEGD